MTPQRAGLEVAHDEASLPEFPGDLKDERLFVFGIFGTVHDAIEAKVSPRRGNGRAVQSIIDDLAPWPGEHVNGVGPGVAIDRKGKNKVIIVNRGHFRGLDEGSIFDRWKRLHERFGLKLPFAFFSQAEWRSEY